MGVQVQNNLLLQIKGLKGTYGTKQSLFCLPDLTVLCFIIANLVVQNAMVTCNRHGKGGLHEQ